MAAVPAITFSTNRGAYSAPANRTPYMLRYEIQCVTSVTAGNSNTLTVLNSSSGSSSVPNWYFDALAIGPLRGVLEVAGAGSVGAAAKYLFENENLRITLWGTDPTVTWSMEAAESGNIPELTITAATAAAGSVTSFAYLTIEYRHTIEQ